MSMETLLAIIFTAPIPTIFVAAGLFFWLISVAPIKGIKPPPERQKFSVVFGFVLLVAGIVLYGNNAPKSASDQTATPTLAVAKQVETLTPVLMNSSTPTIGAVISSSTNYDDFNNSALDGSYDLSKWILNSSSGKVFQQSGVLVIQLESAKGHQVSLRAIKYSDLVIGFPMFFEADLMVQKPQSGHVYIILLSDLPSGAYSDCIAGALFGCGYQVSKETYILDDTQILENYGSWHKVRIEINPTTMEIAHLIDGQKIASFIPPNVAELKSAKFTFAVGFYSDIPNQTFTGYVDNVRIGAMGQ